MKKPAWSYEVIGSVEFAIWADKEALLGTLRDEKYSYRSENIMHEWRPEIDAAYNARLEAVYAISGWTEGDVGRESLRRIEAGESYTEAELADMAEMERLYRVLCPVIV